jgi:hypothetical protein
MPILINKIIPSAIAANNTVDIKTQIGTDFFKFDSIGQIISTGVKTAIVIGAIIFFVFLIWGGIQWLSSGGDKTAVQQARDRLTHAIIGLIILALSWAVWIFVLSLLGIEGLSVGE